MKTSGKLFIGMGMLLCLVGGMTFWAGTYYGTPGSENEEQEKASSDPGPNISADRSVAEKSGPEPKALTQKNPGDVTKPAATGSGNTASSDPGPNISADRSVAERSGSEPKALTQKNPGDVTKPAATGSGNKEEPAVEIPAPKGDENDHAEDEGKHKFTNNLIKETSPYLLQHAHNPVNWYPWGEEAFRKAKREDKPIFLSVGYSTCHWCHVMERESFENEAIAKIMNEHFISVKVDREERPDVDQIYMSAVQMMTGSGGWPMSVFLTPDRKPFWGGTYFPPEPKWGRPGFRQILLGLAKKFKEDRANVNQRAAQLAAAIQTNSKLDVLRSRSRGGEDREPAPTTATKVTRAPLVSAIQSLKGSFDRSEGGFGRAPKFPPKMHISILLREHFKTGDRELLQMVTLTLDKMARGGIYDHVGGGFHRYSTDGQWLVPHFEKMLYDNALLSQVYLDAYQVTDDPFYRRVAEEIFEYVMREMTDARGGFFSATDADSEGEEGKFFIWEKSEILSVLGEDDGKLFSLYYNIKDGGNFSSHEHYHAGLNIIHVPRDPEEIAKEAGLEAPAMERRLATMRKKLWAVRAKRIPPGLDDKVLTAWNGLMISGFARGYQVLGDPRYRKAAERSADFVLNNMMRNGRLLRTYRSGRAKLMGYVNDYAYFIAGLIDLYEATFEIKWLDHAIALNEQLIKHYWDKNEGGFFFTAHDHEVLISRSKKFEDGAIPAGNSLAVMNLLRLAKLTDNESYYRKAERTLLAINPLLGRYSRAFSSMLAAVDFFVEGPKEIAIAGRPDATDTQKLLDTVYSYYLPNRVVALVDPSSDGAEKLGKKMPLLAGKRLIGGKAACFVCRNFACKLPVTTAAGVVKALGISKKK